LYSEIDGVSVQPSQIAAGSSLVALVIDPLAPGTRLRGNLILQTPMLARRIRLNGSATRSPDDNADVGDGQILWEAETSAAPASPPPKATPQKQPPKAPSTQTRAKQTPQAEKKKPDSTKSKPQKSPANVEATKPRHLPPRPVAPPEPPQPSQPSKRTTSGASVPVSPLWDAPKPAVETQEPESEPVAPPTADSTPETSSQDSTRDVSSETTPSVPAPVPSPPPPELNPSQPSRRVSTSIPLNQSVFGGEKPSPPVEESETVGAESGGASIDDVDSSPPAPDTKSQEDASPTPPPRQMKKRKTSMDQGLFGQSDGKPS
ncbi:MAG: hypothetical protein KDA84_27265, partial [Planctomycetaceae bacterium]|nr:hypothetical protein [Planctomycetaceae bacterium]